MTRTIVLLLSLLVSACSGVAGPDAGLDAGTDSGADSGADAGDECIPITVSNWRLAEIDDVSIRYRARIEPNLGSEAWSLDLWFIRYNLDYVGEFPLGQGPELNFGTCARCVVAFYATDLSRGFFADQGTLESRADPFLQELDLTLRDVRLIEVTFEGPTIESVPVPNGRCLRLTEASVTQVFPSQGWRCPVEQFRDGTTCNCNCGAHDPDCDGCTLPPEPGCDPTPRPVAGCMANDVCTYIGMCSETCDHPGRVPCERGGVCGYSPEGDRCLTPALERIDGAALGETCEIGNFMCGVDAQGFAMGVCDSEDGWVCTPTCDADADCTVPGEICLGVFSSDAGLRGYCRPPFTPEG